jgi:hypothetical protein
MSKTVEEKIKSLEEAIKLLQGIEVEHFEELSSNFSNRAESQLNLLRYLFKRCQMLKIFTKSAVRESGLKEDVIDRLWSEAEKSAETEGAEEEIFAEYRQELRLDDDRD